MTDRSMLAEVRNPVLGLPGIAALQRMPDTTRAAIAKVFTAIAKDARERANKAWASHKAPMACYWKAVGVYAGHFARAIKPPRPPAALVPPGTLDGCWHVQLFYNGRVEGGSCTVEGFCDRADDPHETVGVLQREALRRNGAIFVNGWTVNWREAS